MANSTQICRVQRSKNCTATVSLRGAAKYDHVTQCLKEVGRLNIKQKYYFELGILVHNITNKRIHYWLFTQPRMGDFNKHILDTRYQKQLYLPKYHKCLGEKPLTVPGSLWNILPTTNSSSFFKHNLKSHLRYHRFNFTVLNGKVNFVLLFSSLLVIYIVLKFTFVKC